MKEFLKDLGILLLYLVTQPFVILYNYFKLLLIKTDKVGRPKFLHKLFFFLFVLYYFIIKNYTYAYTFLVCTIISTLKFHWDTGIYKHWWKERKIKKLKKKYPEVVKEDGQV